MCYLTHLQMKQKRPNALISLPHQLREATPTCKLRCRPMLQYRYIRSPTKKLRILDSYESAMMTSETGGAVVISIWLTLGRFNQQFPLETMQTERWKYNHDFGKIRPHAFQVYYFTDDQQIVNMQFWFLYMPTYNAHKIIFRKHHYMQL
jgi:hypothetical protein